MITYALVAQMRRAQGLEELLGLLTLAAEIDPRGIDQVRGELPTFGGPEPRWTRGVLSWDRERLLVGTAPPFRIIYRREWAA